MTKAATAAAIRRAALTPAAADNMTLLRLLRLLRLLLLVVVAVAVTDCMRD